MHFGLDPALISGQHPNPLLQAGIPSVAKLIFNNIGEIMPYYFLPVRALIEYFLVLIQIPSLALEIVLIILEIFCEETSIRVSFFRSAYKVSEWIC